MIIRVYRAITHDGKAEEFKRIFLENALPRLRQQPGLISATPGLPLETSPNEFLMVMLWQDLDSVRRFAGENWQQARIDPDEADLLKETFVYHYEAV